jgi:hypothetical protein
MELIDRLNDQVSARNANSKMAFDPTLLGNTGSSSPANQGFLRIHNVLRQQA